MPSNCKAGKEAIPMKYFSNICRRSVFVQCDSPILASVMATSLYGKTDLTYERFEESCGDGYTGSLMCFDDKEYDEPFIDDKDMSILLEEMDLYSCAATGKSKKTMTL